MSVLLPPLLPPSRTATARAMTRCECARVAFEEVARAVRDGASPEAAISGTGCGALCTACLPDLEAFLRSDRRG